MLCLFQTVHCLMQLCARARAIARLARGQLWAAHSWGAGPCEPFHGSARAAAAAAAADGVGAVTCDGAATGRPAAADAF